MTRFGQLGLTAFVMSYLLVVLSGIVRFGDTPSTLVLDVLHWTLVAGVAALTVGMLIIGWRTRHENRLLLVLPILGAVLLLSQIILEIVTSRADQAAGAVATHLSLTEAYLGVAVITALLASAPQIARAVGGRLGTSMSALGKLSVAGAISIFVLMFTGAYTSTLDTGAGCSDWPLCDGQLLPSGWTALDIHLTHRGIALIASILVIAVAVAARRVRSDSPAIVGLATAAATLMVAQIFVGAAGIWLEFGTVLGMAHLAVATIIWGLLVTIAVVDRLIPVTQVERPEPVTDSRLRLRLMLSDYFTLTKPNVLTLLLVTTLGAMMIAQAGLPPLGLVFWTLVGGALSAGGAGALNHYMDRDIDAIMSRTRKRPLPGGRIPSVHVPIFGITLSVLAVYVLTVFVNPLAAIVALGGNLFYVFVYTRWLKRATPQNIVIGGAAGAVPPVVGWVAVTNSIGLPALLMFGVIFYWTPPHFWALALFKKTDYSAANVPMFPAVYGEQETRRHILLYTIMLVIVSLFFFPLQVMGIFYLISALVLGGLFLAKAIQLSRQPDMQDQIARSLFFYSLWYLALLFAAMVIDRVIWG